MALIICLYQEVKGMERKGSDCEKLLGSRIDRPQFGVGNGMGKHLKRKDKGTSIF